MSDTSVNLGNPIDKNSIITKTDNLTLTKDGKWNLSIKITDKVWNDMMNISNAADWWAAWILQNLTTFWIDKSQLEDIALKMKNLWYERKV